MNVSSPWIDTLPEDLSQLAAGWAAAQPLPAEYESRLWQRLRIEWNYNSNHIEGNTLTYGETLLLLIHGRTRGDHLMREYEEMRGHDVAIELVRALAREDRPLGEGEYFAEALRWSLRLGLDAATRLVELEHSGE